MSARNTILSEVQKKGGSKSSLKSALNSAFDNANKTAAAIESKKGTKKQKK